MTITTNPGRNEQKQRIVILGAGTAGLAAAYGLSATAELRNRYAVTVYQAGWRVGGKMASGRVGPENRISMNGTHYLFGCYNNAFHMAKDAFETLNAEGEHGFGTFEEAFIPTSTLAFKHCFGDEWHDWIVEMPTNDEQPGTPGRLPEPAVLLDMMVQTIAPTIVSDLERLSAKFPRISAALEPLERVAADLLNVTVTGVAEAIGALAKRIFEDPGLADRAIELLVNLLKSLRRAYFDAVASELEKDVDVYRRWVMADVSLSMLIGLVQDRGLEPGGLLRIDELDFRDWLRSHGASRLALESPIVQGWYDTCAAYEDGERSRPNVGAGATVNSLIMACWTYKGAFAYQAAREVGDSWVAPVFALLRRRGVDFRLFHRVWDVKVDGERVLEVSVESQAVLKKECAGVYEPFITVRNRKVWPDRPLYDQLENPGAIENVDLEDFYAPRCGEVSALTYGKDFDTVVYAMPVETIRAYGKSILETQRSWRDMIAHVRGTDTQTMWAYFRPDLKGIGWNGKPPILTSYLAPFSTWEDVTFLREWETWPEGHVPGTICSLMGPLPGPTVSPPPEDPADYPQRQCDAVQESCWRFFTDQIYPIWPGVTRDKHCACVEWEALIDRCNGVGDERFKAQVWKANYGPNQRYTLSLAGSVRYRLRVDEAGYENLYLAGDWVRNGSDIGTVEGAVVSGLQAAVAISGTGEVSIAGLPDSGL